MPGRIVERSTIISVGSKESYSSCVKTGESIDNQGVGDGIWINDLRGFDVFGDPENLILLTNAGYTQFKVSPLLISFYFGALLFSSPSQRPATPISFS